MVEILKVHQDNPDLAVIRKARRLITAGKLVIFPTDTLYGLAADPSNEDAVMTLLQVKRRDTTKGLPVLTGDLDLAEKLVEFSPTAKRIASKFWPGALTLVLPLKISISELVTGQRSTLGVRVPNHNVARQLAVKPIVGTSANLSNHPSPVTAEDAIEQIGEFVDLVLDSGPTRIGLPSTILDLSGASPELLREGSIKFADLKQYLS